MTKRFKPNAKKSKKQFSKTARKTKSVNVQPHPQRGGFRL